MSDLDAFKSKGPIEKAVGEAYLAGVARGRLNGTREGMLTGLYIGLVAGGCLGAAAMWFIVLFAR
jgi:hypothetical protein